jgi:hypothetical protein
MSVDPARCPASPQAPAPEDGIGVPLEQARQRGVGAERQVARQRLDLHGGAQRQGAGLQRAIDLQIGVADALEGAPAHVGLDPRLAGDDVHLRAPVGQDGVHANRVLVAEGLALRIDRGERDLRRVERVDPGVRRAARVRRASRSKRAVFPNRPLFDPGTHAGPSSGRDVGVDHHREIDVVQVAEAQKLALAAEELEPSGRAPRRAATRDRRPPRRARP